MVTLMNLIQVIWYSSFRQEKPTLPPTRSRASSIVTFMPLSTSTAAHWRPKSMGAQRHELSVEYKYALPDTPAPTIQTWGIRPSGEICRIMLGMAPFIWVRVLCGLVDRSRCIRDICPGTLSWCTR